MVRAGLRMAATALALTAAAPGAAQMMSDGYEFLEAVRDRDGTKATEALSRPGTVLVNSRDISSGETALHIVARRRDALWIRFLASKGANPNVADENGVTPLEISTSLGHAEGVEALLDAGARVDAPNSTGETPLISAIHRRDAEIVELLLEHGADPDRTDNSGRSARDYAERMGSGNRMLAKIAEAEAGGEGKQKTYGPKL